ncbi:MAG: N-acetyltransferase [Promethearchaeota archaeon]|nr:MAG: N-acetyltransferase [Candidatus Lokiarchaeota archaeon]
MEKGPKSFSIIHPETNINNKAFIDDFVVIGKGVSIGSDVYISKGVKIYGKAIIKTGTYIGENCIIGHFQRNQLKEVIASKKPVTDFEGTEVIIDENCIIRAGTIIYSDVRIGAKCQTGHNVLIREKTKIGDSSLIGTNCIIDGNVSIGINANIQTGAYIPLFCSISNNVFMGPYSKLTNDKYMLRKEFELIGPTIEDNVSLGANSIIFPGIRLKKGTIVGAGAVVNKNTEEGDIIVGNPAKRLKKIPDDWK